MDAVLPRVSLRRAPSDPRAGPLQGGVAHPRSPGCRDPGRGAPRAGPELLREQLPRPFGPPRAAGGRAPGPRRMGLRHVQRALHLRHPGPAPGAREEARRLPRHGGRDPLRRLLRRQRRGLRAPARRGRRDHRRQAEPRLDHRRRAPVQGQALPLRARRPGRPRGEAQGGRGGALPDDRHRRRLLDGRRHRPPRRRSATSRSATARW